MFLDTTTCEDRWSSLMVTNHSEHSNHTMDGHCCPFSESTNMGSLSASVCHDEVKRDSLMERLPTSPVSDSWEISNLCTVLLVFMASSD